MKFSAAEAAVALHLASLIAGMVGLVGNIAWAQALKPEIWFAGVDSVVRPSQENGVPSDYMALFAPNAPWAKAASHIKVFQTSTQFISKATDDELKLMFSDLKRRHITLAMAALILSGDGRCGVGVEGYSAPRQMLAAAERIKRLGGELRYVAMDGPLMGGHFANGAGACHTPIAELASEVARKVAQFKSVFPDVEIGDIEPLGVSAPANWVDVYMQWASAYQSAVGEPLSFVHFDVQWRGPWRLQIAQLTARLRAVGTRTGAVYNGFGIDQTDAQWTQHAIEHAAEVEVDRAIAPDHAIIQSWNRRPSRFLPEEQPGTMTWLVNRYVTRGR